jgi:DNA-binding transcriptional regulator GbsR (MarR family)
MSVKEFREHLLDSILNILWKQWSALGIYSNVEQENKFLIDPESLLCATCSFGRFDQRLFDEVIIWLCENGNLLNIGRLKNVLVLFEGLEINILGAISEYLSLKEKKKWDRVVLFCNRKKKDVETQNLFMNKDSIPIPIVGKPDEIFLKWDLRRNEVNLRHIIREMDMENPCNLLFKMRSFFGVNARADICAFLLFSDGDNSLQISKKVHLNQRNIYQVLNEMCQSGLVEKKHSGKRNLYTLDHSNWSDFFKIDKSISYIIWAKAFSALNNLFEQMIQQPEKFEDSYLASSNLREISEKFIPEIQFSGLKVQSKHLERVTGELFTPQFIDYVEKILHQLMGKTN